MQLLADPLRRLVEQPLQLLRAETAFELRDASGEHLLATLDCATPVACADAGDTRWLLGVERRRGWQLVARTQDGEPVACYHPGALPGGRIWVAPDTWGTLRRTHLRWQTSWRLRIDGDELLRMSPDPKALPGGYEIVIGPACVKHPELSLLLVPFTCWVELTEQTIDTPTF